MSLQCPSENQPENGKFADERGTYIREYRAWRKARKPSYIKGLRAIRCGAGDGGRTHTVLPPTDFESVSSANSNTPADLVVGRTLIEYECLLIITDFEGQRKKNFAAGQKTTAFPPRFVILTSLG